MDLTGENRALMNTASLPPLLVLAANLVSAWASDLIVVRPKESQEVLVNPGMGFTTFQRFNGDSLNDGLKWTEGFPIEYQPFTGSLTNQNHPLTSIAYFRVYWRFVEPKPGEYQWALFDRALATARARGQTLMLRIAPYGTGTDNDVPDWYRALVAGQDLEKNRIITPIRVSSQPTFICSRLHKDWRRGSTTATGTPRGRISDCEPNSVSFLRRRLGIPLSSCGQNKLKCAESQLSR